MDKYTKMAREWVHGYGNREVSEDAPSLASLLRQVAEEQMETDAKIADGPHNFNTLNTDRIANAIRAQKGQQK